MLRQDLPQKWLSLLIYCGVLFLLRLGVSDTFKTLPVGGRSDLTSYAIEADTELQMKVHLEAVRVPVEDVLADLQQQSGMKLEAAPPLSKFPLTIHINGLSLGAVMASLQRLYATTWSKTTANTYTLNQSDLKQVEQELARVGDGYYLPGRTRETRSTALVNWNEEITDAVGQDALHGKGIAFTDLPEQAQVKLRQDMQERAASDMIWRLSRTSLINITDSVLNIDMPHFRKPKKAPPPNAFNEALKTTPVVSLIWPHNRKQFLVYLGYPSHLIPAVADRDKKERR